ncbi:hypothetical protein NDI45_20315 [Leptolyngbya sp. GB1-A1]|uniref:nucleotide-binding protein n=1 Tax=Leptolyngbya sp. GB1-A1 TaxID=2933908 RepID=UPI003298A549
MSPKLQPDPIDLEVNVSSAGVVLLGKVLIFITGDKGGTGKSTCARALAALLIRKGIATRAFDADNRNSQLYRYCNKAFSEGVQQINLAQPTGGDNLINAFQSSASVLLVDLPAGAGDSFEVFAKKMKLFKLAKREGYTITLVSVLSRVKESVQSLSYLLDFCGTEAQHIACKNLFNGEPEKFKRFDNSLTRDKLLSCGGAVVHLPDLPDDTIDLLEEESLSFTAALESPKFDFADRMRIEGFLDDFEESIEQAGMAQYLGLR